MLSILGHPVRLGDGWTRREVLRVGGLGFAGLLWSDLLRARASSAARIPPAGRSATGSFGKAKACILIFNYGGPSHLDLWDLKPDAPREIRGEFQPIATRVPGTSITEHLPRLAALADRYAILRSVNHPDNDHAVGTYLALTGYPHPRSRPLGIEPPASPLDMPSLGSVVSKLRAPSAPVFPYVTLGVLRHLGNHDSMGQDAGCLGKVYDPFTVPNAAKDPSSVQSVLGAVARERLVGRRQLLHEIDRASSALEATIRTRNQDGFARRAYELLASPDSRAAFELAREPDRVRDAYGPSDLGQNCLLARRLVEAGVPLVTVYSVENRDWDTHANNFPTLKNTLLPATDRSVSALLDDLDRRGLLTETLVVWMGDMGRTPRINGGAGRDHWSFCYSIVMAGGGVRGGLVYGSSDRIAAYPSAAPVSPADIAATIYHSLGIDHRAHVTDQQGRPFVIGTGEPILSLLGEMGGGS
jgi:hypothetical protein